MTFTAKVKSIWPAPDKRTGLHTYGRFRSSGACSNVGLGTADHKELFLGAVSFANCPTNPVLCCCRPAFSWAAANTSRDLQGLFPVLCLTGCVACFTANEQGIRMFGRSFGGRGPWITRIFLNGPVPGSWLGSGSWPSWSSGDFHG